MGSWYNIVWLANVAHVEGSNEKNGWSCSSRPLTLEELAAWEELEDRHSEERSEMLSKLL